MAGRNLFPVVDLPQIPDDTEETAKYHPSVYFDFEKGDFRLDGANRMVEADGKEAFMQWCLKTVDTEREKFLAYSSDIGTELRYMESLTENEAKESWLERTITDALMVHPATEYVRDFEFDLKGDECAVKFTVKGHPWNEEILETTIRG